MNPCYQQGLSHPLFGPVSYVPSLNQNKALRVCKEREELESRQEGEELESGLPTVCLPLDLILQLSRLHPLSCLPDPELMEGDLNGRRYPGFNAARDIISFTLTQIFTAFTHVGVVLGWLLPSPLSLEYMHLILENLQSRNGTSDSP